MLLPGGMLNEPISIPPGMHAFLAPTCVAVGAHTERGGWALGQDDSEQHRRQPEASSTDGNERRAAQTATRDSADGNERGADAVR